MQLINKLSWLAIVIMCLTLGLAPFNPPHVFTKISMLLEGHLVKPMDWFDLIMHGAPWMLLIIKGVAELRNKK